MRYRCLPAIMIALMIAVSARPVHAAPLAVSGAAPGLVRVMLASARYVDMVVEIDGQQVLRQPANTMSTYLPIAPDKPHTLAI